MFWVTITQFRLESISVTTAPLACVFLDEVVCLLVHVALHWHSSICVNVPEFIHSSSSGHLTDLQFGAGS